MSKLFYMIISIIYILIRIKPNLMKSRSRMKSKLRHNYDDTQLPSDSSNDKNNTDDDSNNSLNNDNNDNSRDKNTQCKVSFLILL